VLNKNIGCNIDCLEFLHDFNALILSYLDENLSKTKLMPFSDHGLKPAPLRSMQDLISDLGSL